MTATTTNTTNTMTPSTLTCVSIESTIKPAAYEWTHACYKHKAYFPASGAYAVHQSGEALSGFSKGLTVELTQKVGSLAPHAFEFYSDDQRQYASGGLWFDDLDLSDYDGVFNLPKEVCAMLRALGFNTEYAD